MKFISIVVIAFAAMVILPESSNAWLAVRCSTFDAYKSDVSRWFSYRDARINSVYSLASSARSKACYAYSKVKNFDAVTKKMEAYMRSQGYTNSRLTSQMYDLKNKNAALRKEMEALQASINSINSKNSQQDSELSRMRFYNCKQDNRISSIESVNSKQSKDLQGLRANNAAQDRSIGDLQSVNSRQDSAISDLRNKDASQDRAISAINAKNAAQDRAISDVKKVNDAQHARINDVVAVNVSQEDKIMYMLNHLKTIAETTTQLVKKLLSDFGETLNKCVFSDDMFMCMLTPPPRPAYTYTRASTINAEQLLNGVA